MGEPLPVSALAHNLCKFDGGCDLDLLGEMPALSEHQQEFLASSSEDDWRRPVLDVEASAGSAASICGTPITCLPVGQTPQYRLRSLLCAEEGQEADAAAWQAAFCLAPW